MHVSEEFHIISVKTRIQISFLAGISLGSLQAKLYSRVLEKRLERVHCTSVGCHLSYQTDKWTKNFAQVWYNEIMKLSGGTSKNKRLKIEVVFAWGTKRENSKIQTNRSPCLKNRSFIDDDSYSVFHRFRQAEFAYSGSVLCSSQLKLLLQLPQKWSSPRQWF